MVNQVSPEELIRRVKSLENELDQIKRQLREHIGFQYGANTANVPHPQMVNLLNEYTIDNLTNDRTYDANTVAVAELADIVGTLLLDLNDAGLIRAREI